MYAVSWIRRLSLQEGLRFNPRLPENGSECAFRHIAGMVGKGGVTAGGGVVTDLMTAGGLTVEFEPELLDPPDNIPVPEARVGRNSVLAYSAGWSDQ